ncbi:peroxidase-like isoform X4 [Daktulosphaira vitifoliae]|uniref:peroxidase-like isoform X4 n=1 Tax=Daktulosphaira vitifoliae TaxID=58002 RepID=UPI0021A9B4B7|nr:peroxidase-like isoform X4 [Daktulosphaira vitifoliae]
MSRFFVILFSIIIVETLSHQSQNINDDEKYDTKFIFDFFKKKPSNHPLNNTNAFICKNSHDSILLKEKDLNPQRHPGFENGMHTINMLSQKEIDLSDQCFSRPQCNSNAPFRTADGSCNNLQFPTWGKSDVAVTRIIQADYSDGINQPRKTVSGEELPNSRIIRTTIFPDKDQPSPDHTVYVTQYGQVIAHDTELAVEKKTSTGKEPQCCNPDGSFPEDLPAECISVFVPENDSEMNKRCIPITRVKDTLDIGCNIKPVRQIIGVTSFLDLSLLYGSNDETAQSLRTFNGGKLKFQLGPNDKIFLSNVENPMKSCNGQVEKPICYTAGDTRVNQQPGIAVSTITLLRLHNFLCEELNTINPQWDDERLYQESRKMLIGMYQHVTYNEFVPIILGSDFAKLNELLPLKKGYDNRYDQSLNPTTFSSFTATAYRAFHSYIQRTINLMNEFRKTTSSLQLSDVFFKSDLVQENDNFDSITRGMITQHAQGQDQFFTSQISNLLFKKTNPLGGLDLISIDISRGRDYGEPSYNQFRLLCGLPLAKTFDDLLDQIDQENVSILASLYKDVNDIDFYVAGMVERLKPGAILGHTFQCVVGEMFYRWKFGDRYYYEFKNSTGAFTLNQLDQIRKTTFAQILCLTSDIQMIQSNPFFNLREGYQAVPCNCLKNINFSAWKE